MEDGYGDGGLAMVGDGAVYVYVCRCLVCVQSHFDLLQPVCVWSVEGRF